MLNTKKTLPPGRVSRLRPVPPLKSRPAAQYSRSFWYALYLPQLSDLSESKPHAINDVASLCLRVSDYISIAGNDALVVEIRSSLKYFGGIRFIRQTIQLVLQAWLQQWQLPGTCYDAASPSASASLILARAKISRVVPDAQNLRSALGSVPVANLAVDTKTLHRLEQCGLLYLRDLWRLPAAGLRIRFGRTLSEYLEQLLALRPSTPPRWHADLSFCETLTPDIPAENHRDFIALAAELLRRMQQFLQQHHLSTDHVLFQLHDEAGAEQSFKLGTRYPVRDAAIWLLLVENRVAQLKLPQGVSSLTLSILEFHDYHPAGAHPKERIKDRTYNRKNMTQYGLLEAISARLGKQTIFCLNQQEDYDPVAAGKYLEYPDAQKNSTITASQKTPGFGLHQQPCWLLSSPLPLRVQHEAPVYLSPLIFVRGPERIETHWWSGKNIRRDYYIASNQQGMMLWIYRDIGKRSWFLQGLFG